MDYFVSGIDPLYAVGSNSNIDVSKIRTKADASNEFASMFISQVFKEFFKSQSSLFGGDASLGAYSDNLYNDILLAKISKELAQSKAFGFDQLLAADKQ